MLSFLNATIKPAAGKEITTVRLENTEITKQALKDKTAVLDIRAITGDGTQINIEVQLVDEHNIEKRTLFYWSKLYSEQLAIGQNYKELKQTITINILDFNYLKGISSPHSVFHLKDDESGLLLTADIEIHFLELKKFDSYNPDVKTSDPLSQWMLFLKLENEQVLEVIAMTNPVIHNAFNKLDVLSKDKKARAQYEQRLKAMRDRNSILDGAREEDRIVRYARFGPLHFFLPLYSILSHFVPLAPLDAKSPSPVSFSSSPLAEAEGTDPAGTCPLCFRKQKNRPFDSSFTYVLVRTII